MDGISKWLEKHMLPIANKIGSQRHLSAIKNGFIATMPLALVGALAVMFNNVFLQSWSLIGELLNRMSFYANTIQPFWDRTLIPVFGQLWWATIALAVLFSTFTIAYSFAKEKGEDGLAAGVIAIAAYLTLIAQVMGHSSVRTVAPESAEALQQVYELVEVIESDSVEEAQLIRDGEATTVELETFITEYVFEGDTTLRVTIGEAIEDGEIVPTHTEELINDDGIWGALNWTSFNSSAIFAGLITALVAAELFCFVKRKGWVIKMPDQVPPAVSRAFSAVIPAAIVLFIFGSVSIFFLDVIEMPVGEWINEMLQRPLVRLGQSPIALIFLMILSQLLWFFGIHGLMVVEPALTLMYGPALAENTELVMQGLEPIHVITRNFLDVYGMHGGSGATLGLIVAIFIFSKRAHYRTLAKMASPAGVFQINEPMIFGLPLVLNPMMAIPFVLIPAINIFIAWFFTAVIPFAGLIEVGVPWVTPPIISAFLATNGSITATILAAVTFALSILMYAPFVIAANKEKDAV